MPYQALQPYYRKKKSELAPKPSSNKPEKRATASPSKSSVEDSGMKKKPVPVYTEYKSSSLSLNDIARKKEPEPDQVSESAEQQKATVQNSAFSQEKLTEYWLEFAGQIQEDMPRIFQVLKNHLPEKADNDVIQLKLDNITQQKDVNEKIKNRLVAFLKEKLNNSKIDLLVEVMEQLEDNQVIYSSAEKFNYLVEQNEAVQKLKKEFNLDLE